MKKWLSTKYGWIDTKTFKDGVALCQVIPGATTMQGTAYVGLKIKGILGALLTYRGFGLPAFFLMFLLSVLCVRFYNLQQVLALFSGLQVMVVAIILNAPISFCKRCMKHYRDVAIAFANAVFFGWAPAHSWS